MSNLTVTTYSSTGSGVRTLDFTNGNIIVTSTGTIVSVQYPNLTVTGATSGNGFDIRNNTATAATVSMGSGGTEAQAINLLVSQGTYGLTLSSPAMVRDLNFTGFSGSLATNPALTIYGNLTLASTMTTLAAGANEWTFASTNASERTLTFAGETVNNPLRFNGVGGSWKFLDSFIGNASYNIIPQNGTIDFNSQSITVANAITSTTGTVTFKNLNTARPATIISGAIVNLGTNITSGAWTLTQGNLNLDTYTYTSPSVTWSGASNKTIDFGTSGKLVVNANTTSTVFTGTSTAYTTVGNNPLVEFVGGTSAGAITKTLAVPPFTEAQALNFSFLDTSSSVTYDFNQNPSHVKNLLINGTQTFAANRNFIIYGDYIYDDSGGTKVTTFATGGGTWTFSSTNVSARTLSASSTTSYLPSIIYVFNGAGGSWTLSSNFGQADSRSTTLTNGTIDLNGYTFSVGSFVTGVGTKTLLFDGGTLNVIGSGATAFNNIADTNFTITKGTGTGTIKMSSSIAKTFVGGSKSYPIILDQGGPGNLTITGTNTFENLSSSYSAGIDPLDTSILFPAGSTTTFTNLTVAGGSTATRRLTLGSATTGSRWTLDVTNGNPISLSGVVIRDCNPIIANNRIFYALLTNNCVNGGNNVYWTFGNEALSFF